MVAQHANSSPARFYNAKSGVVATFNERALDLAEAHGLIGTGRGVALTYTDDGDTPAWVTVRVVSQSKADVTYDVVYTVATDHALCRCTAAAFARMPGRPLRMGATWRRFTRPRRGWRQDGWL